MVQSRDDMIPHSVELEKAAIGSLLIDPNAIQRVQGIIRGSGDFYIQKNAWIWEALIGMKKKRIPVDIVTVCDALEERGILNEVGGAAYISQLINAVPTSVHVDTYLKRLHQLALRRDGISVASELAQAAYNEDETYQTTKNRLAQGLLREGVRDTHAVPVAVAADELYRESIKFQENPLKAGEVRGLSTGIMDLDSLLGGLEAALYIIGAVTHIGKTFFCLAVAMNLAQQGHKVLFFTLEMTAKQLLERMVCSRAHISRNEYRSGNLTQEQWKTFYDWMGEITGWPLIIYQNLFVMAEMEAEIYRELPVDFIVVDWMGLVRGSTKTKTHEVLGDVAGWGLELAQNPDILAPVWMSQQISFNTVKGRKDKHPEPGDLYKSDEPHQRTDELILLHRDDRYEVQDKSKHTNLLDASLWKSRVKGMPMGTANLRYTQYGEVLDATPAELALPEERGPWWND